MVSMRASMMSFPLMCLTLIACLALVWCTKMRHGLVLFLKLTEMETLHNIET